MEVKETSIIEAILIIKGLKADLDITMGVDVEVLLPKVEEEAEEVSGEEVEEVDSKSNLVVKNDIYHI